MKHLAIDWLELSAAFDSSFPITNHYLDTETGQVLMVAEPLKMIGFRINS